MTKRVYEIDGSKSSTLEEFADHFTEQLNLQTNWHGNLDAFNDILRGGFGTPDDGFVLIWKNSEVSRDRLGYPQTINWLEDRVLKCHPSNVEHFRERIALAKQREGATLFDTLVEIITLPEHSDVELRLE
jgi:RNAse (barnase) inhibitor barstar